MVFKSSISKRIAAMLGLPVLSIKLSDTNMSDFAGVPIPVSSDINVGDMILMEYACGVVETVVVDAVEDGIVYGLGDDGEPYCAPITNCDKVPY